MCPDPQLLSIYMDEEMPSPWKEKMEIHLTECSVCREKYANLRRIQELLTEKADEKPEQTAKDRIWQKLSNKRRYRPQTRLWQRRISIPLPAAAGLVLVIIAGLWLRGGQVNNDRYAETSPFEKTGFSIAAEEEQIRDIIPNTDINSILQYFASDGTDTIILNLPESRNFYRTGEPGIVKAADYQRIPGR